MTVDSPAWAGCLPSFLSPSSSFSLSASCPSALRSLCALCVCVIICRLFFLLSSLCNLFFADLASDAGNKSCSSWDTSARPTKTQEDPRRPKTSRDGGARATTGKQWLWTVRPAWAGCLPSFLLFILFTPICFALYNLFVKVVFGRFTPRIVVICHYETL